MESSIYIKLHSAIPYLKSPGIDFELTTTTGPVVDMGPEAGPSRNLHLKN